MNPNHKDYMNACLDSDDLLPVVKSNIQNMISAQTIALIAAMQLTPANTYTLLIKDANSAVEAIGILSDTNYEYYLNKDNRYIPLRECQGALLLLTPLQLTNISIVSNPTRHADINLNCTLKYRGTEATFDLLKI